MSDMFWHRLKAQKAARIHTRDKFFRVQESIGDVVEVTLPSTAQTQVSVLSDGDGFLIRVWPDHGVHEFDGNNLTFFSAVIRSVDGIMTLDHLTISQDEQPRKDK